MEKKQAGGGKGEGKRERERENDNVQYIMLHKQTIICRGEGEALL